MKYVILTLGRLHRLRSDVLTLLSLLLCCLMGKGISEAFVLFSWTSYLRWGGDLVCKLRGILPHTSPMSGQEFEKEYLVHAVWLVKQKI